MKETLINKVVLSEEEKNRIVNFCGYPYSQEDVLKFSSWRILQGHGTLLYRLNVLSEPEIGVTIQYLNTLICLEDAIPKNNKGEIITDAITWTPDVEEVRSRIQFFNLWRSRLCGFLGVPTGPFIPTLTGE